ncbi:MAG: tetraacyldisaccharide 4'-kinase [Candidatus Paracaedibacteraceae bacterium]|nr:tetraacyldisaccharide 4'-kinase [Candidatus Paracaedibacteraceae bacterium]
MFRSPRFWDKKQWMSYFLIPLSWLWTRIAKWNEKSMESEEVSVPVICVGNLVMGGAGKTPTVIALVDILKQMGHTPHILSRGYGAYIRNAIQVNPDKHNYLQVGDEPLLLASAATTWAGPNRVQSAKAAILQGATILLMDDGLQNHSLKKDLSFIVVDAIQGIGNGLVFPAGPLREPIESGANRAQAMILIGNDNTSSLDFKNHQFTAQITCIKNTFEKNHNKRVVAFAGIGYPEKFRNTLEKNGFIVCEFIDYADHHPYTIHDMIKLIKAAEDHEAVLITTSKDWFRIPSHYRNVVETLPIALKFAHPDQICVFIKEALEKSKQLNVEKQVPTL